MNVFDFDGTLFKSPVPNPQNWDSKLIGKLKSTIDSQGLGWYQDILTLSEPYVPSNPGEEWFVTHIKEQVRKSMREQKCATALLTGRTVNYAGIIHKIIQSAGLEFDDYGFKPLTEVTTMNFKKQYLRDLVSKYNPKEIYIWEDREKHAKEFEKFFAAQFPGIQCKVNLLTEDYETYLPKEQEIELVNQLKVKSGLSVEWQEIVLYTAVTLTDQSSELLKEKFPPIDGWTPFYHHMTICLGSLLNQQHRNDLPSVDVIGQEVKLTVTHIGQDKRAYAAQVEGYPSWNSRPHITLCVAPNSLPKHSNEIPPSNWEKVKRFELQGHVLEVKRFILKDTPKTQKTVNNNLTLNLGKMVSELTKKKGKEVSAAIKQIKDWLNTQNLEPTTANEMIIMKYIKENLS
uniref:Swiss Army Knife RNA repair protein HAD domain-containing protein n=1 Tax=Arcella intermedia TaxID=1963864 RepID=A0A6B2L658_9EUKA